MNTPDAGSNDPGRDPLGARIEELAGAFEVPAVPASVDLRRGKRSLHRRRVALGAVALAAVTTIVVVASAAWTSVGNRAIPAEPAAVPTANTSVIPFNDDPPGWEEQDYETLMVARQTVARLLDPAGEHVAKEEIENYNSMGPCCGQMIGEVSTTFAWTNPATQATGNIGVTLANTTPVNCSADDTKCAPDDIAGLAATRVTQAGAEESFFAQRADGYFVLVKINDTNTGSIPVGPSGSVAIADERLADVLRETSWTMPGLPPLIVPLSAPANLFAQVAEDHFRSARLRDGKLNDGDVPGYRATVLADGKSIGALSVLELNSGPRLDERCIEAYMRVCELRTIGDAQVRVDRLDDGQIELRVKGRRALYLEFKPTDSDAGPSADELVNFILDSRLQN